MIDRDKLKDATWHLARHTACAHATLASVDRLADASFLLAIETGNDAMSTAEDIANALRVVADYLSPHMSSDEGSIRDIYGNTVGAWSLELSAVDVKPEWIAAAHAIGVSTALNAATWVADGNTKAEGIAYALKLAADGDPRLEECLPARPNLSGEWADDPSPLSLARDITAQDDPHADVVSALAEAWEDGVAETFESACVAELERWAR